MVPASQLLSPRRSISSPTSTVLLQEAASLSATGPAAGASCNAASEIAADAGSQDGVGAAAVADSSQPTGADGIVSYLAQSLEAARARRQAQQGAGMGMAAGLVKGAVAPGLSPEPSDIKQEASKVIPGHSSTRTATPACSGLQLGLNANIKASWHSQWCPRFAVTCCCCCTCVLL